MSALSFGHHQHYHYRHHHQLWSHNAQLVEDVQEQVAELKRRQAIAIAKTIAAEKAYAEKLHLEGPSEPIIAAAHNDTDQAEEYANKGWSPITAAVSGTVLDVRVAVGQKAERGDTLVVIEAMKMEYAITAAEDGVVEKVMVKQGDMSQQGSIVVWLS